MTVDSLQTLSFQTQGTITVKTSNKTESMLQQLEPKLYKVLETTIKTLLSIMSRKSIIQMKNCDLYTHDQTTRFCILAAIADYRHKCMVNHTRIHNLLSKSR